MSIELKIYDNGDHTCLVWLPADGKPIPNCRGFAIRRLRKGGEEYLHGFVGFSDADQLALDTNNATAVTPEMTITGQFTPHLSAYFNKGIVAAQWVSRALDAAPKGSKIKELVAESGNPLRNALSGLLRPQILSLLADTKKKNGKIFAALYELNDPELIPALVAFGKDCNLLLGNGAFKGNN